MRLLSGAFFASGFAALLYQVVWQRALFSIFGIAIESVTLVVTVFMAGLGLGSLFGGAISRRRAVPLVGAFAVAEISLGLFGAVSLPLIDWLGHATLTSSSGTRILAVITLLLVPTLLMGCTLPLLVQHFVSSTKDVGRAVGGLYFFNTIGSACAAGISVFLLMGALGMQGTVYVAVCSNVLAGLAAAFIGVRDARAKVSL